jgi:hypothetical protein
MPAYRDGFVHLLYAIILVQFVAVAVLLGGFSNEYLQNVFFRAWVDSNYPWLGSLLQGQVDALLIGMALGATVLVIQRVRAESTIPDEPQLVIGGPLNVETSSQGSVEGPTSENAGSGGDARRDALAGLDRMDS